MEAKENGMYGLSSGFFEGAEKLLEIWFGNGDGCESLLDELDDLQSISTIIRIAEDDDEEKMSNDSGEDESICHFKNANKGGDQLNVVAERAGRKLDTGDLRRIPREALEQLCQVVKVSG